MRRHRLDDELPLAAVTLGGTTIRRAMAFVTLLPNSRRTRCRPPLVMEVLGVSARETWMVGDNLEWEIVAPQRLGIHAIWHDGYGVGLPPGCPVRPDRIIRRLSELLP